jgi:hypothetical protein
MSQLDDMFATYASPAMQHWFGVTVTLLRGPRKTEDVPATWSRPPEDVDFEGVPLKLTHRVYRIDRDAYVIEGQPVKPMEADLLIEVIGGEACKFKVLPNDNMPAFELDGDGKTWIIRTKKV